MRKQRRNWRLKTRTRETPSNGKLRHDAGKRSPPSLGLGPGTISGHFLRYLQWTKRQWDRH